MEMENKKNEVSVETRIKEILCLILRIDPATPENEMTRDLISKWDSLQHINIISVIEDEFNVSFTTDQLLKMNSFNKIVDEVSHAVPT